MADLLKGLIKLAAAGVKMREGVPKGVRTHAERAENIFLSLYTDSGSNFMGLSQPWLVQKARAVQELAEVSLKIDKTLAVLIVFDFKLNPIRSL